jgi:ABC-type multidrug transport system fused ATPase/permease subunit
MKWKRQTISARGTSGNGLEQGLLVALHDRGVLVGDEGADEFRRLGVRAPEEAQEDDAAAPVVVGQAQQRPEEAVDDLRGLQRLARRRPPPSRRERAALLVEPVQAAPEHLLHQRLLGPEVVIDGSQIDRRLAGDLAHRRSLVTVRHEQALGRIENALAGIDRETGGVSRDIERGSRSISNLISYALYSILPTLVEIGLVLAILFARYDSIFVLITLASLGAYVVFTVKVSNWRIAIRRKVNETDSAANTRAIDSLINYETVKYFNNEEYEAQRYDQQLGDWEDAATRSRISLSWLNLGQQVSIALGVTAMMWRAAAGVVDGTMTIGDLVLVNAFLIQLYMPLNFLGVVYREIRQSLTDIERMFGLLAVNREVADAPEPPP